MKCRSCSFEIQSEAKFCPNCGFKVEIVCPECNAKVEPGSRFCGNCGNLLQKDSNPSEGYNSTLLNSGPTKYYSDPFEQEIQSSMQTSGGFVYASPSGSGVNMSQVPEIPSGEVLLNQFRIDGIIGKGSTGVVYRAFDLNLNEPLAIKTLPTFNKTQQVIEALALEYKAHRAIKHTEHIVRIDRPQTCTFAGLEWIILPMELAVNNFKVWLNETRSDIQGRQKQGLDLFVQACKGVEALHNANMIHLDLKPENLLLFKQKDESWHLKVSDFGMVRGLTQGGLSNPALIRDGVGTPWYMAPEQVFATRQKSIKATADIYALGVILYEILDGDVPFDGEPEVVKLKHKELAPDPLEINNSLLSSVTLKCLSKNPVERIQQVAGIIEQLEGNDKTGKKIAELLEEAKQLFNQGEYKSAFEKLETARNLDNGNDEINLWITKVKAEITKGEETRKAEEAFRKKKEEEERQKREAEERKKAEIERQKREEKQQKKKEAEAKRKAEEKKKIEDKRGKYDIVLWDAGPSKLGVVKLVKEILGIGFKEAKEIVDDFNPKIKEKISIDEAEALRSQFAAAGAFVILISVDEELKQANPFDDIEELPKYGPSLEYVRCQFCGSLISFDNTDSFRFCFACKNLVFKT